MSSENHELRLKIDAAAAQSGSKAFTAAVKAVQTAVRDLERDSSGAFKKLQSNLKSIAATKITIKGIDSSALTSLNSFISGQRNAYKAVMDVNRALRTQRDLAGKTNVTVSPVTAISVKAITSLVREFNKMQSASSAATTTATGGLNGTAAAASSAAAAQRRLNSQLEARKRLELSASGVNRSADVSTARLSGGLAAMGDTKGVAQLNAALATLKSTISSGVSSQTELRAAYSQFQSVANSARLKLIEYGNAQAQVKRQTQEAAAAQKAASHSARSVERELRSITSAAHATRDALRNATGGMRGLENAFSATYQVGSAFRVMLGSITLGSLTSSIFKAGDALDQFRVTSEVATGSASGALDEMTYIENVARRLGVNLQEARDSYSKFAISASLAGVSADQTRHIFESVSTAMSVLGKGTEDQKLAFLALEQMMSKGTISAEELRRQLGERLPGAVNLMAKSIGVTTGELQDMLKAGSLVSAEVLPKFADEIMKTFGPGLENATKRAGFSLRTVQNELIKLSETAAQAGFMDSVGETFRDLTKMLQSSEAVEAAKLIGQGFAELASMAGAAAKFIVENIRTIGQVANAVLVGIFFRAVSLGVAAVTSFLLQLAAWRASTAQAAASQTLLSAAVGRNTKVMVVGTEATLAATAATSALGKASKTAALTSTVTGLASVTRGALLFAPAIGLAAAALYYLYMQFNKSTTASSVFATDFDRAMKSAGKSLDEFDGSVLASATENAFSNLLRQSDVLRQGITKNVAFTSDQIKKLADDIEFLGSGAVAGKASREGLLNSMGPAGGIDIGAMLGLGTSGAEVLTTAAQEESFNKLSSDSKRVMLVLSEQTRAAMEAGKGYLALREALSYALAFNPDATGPIQALMELTKEAATAEYNLTEIRDRTTELFGTEDEKRLKRFKQSLENMLRTGAGAAEIQVEIDQQSGAKLKKQMSAMLDIALSGARRGTNVPLLMQMIQEAYIGAGSTVAEMERLNTAFMTAVKDKDAKEQEFLKALGEAAKADPLLNGYMEQFKAFKDFDIPAQRVTEMFAGIPKTTQEIKDFVQAVTTSYSALSPVDQNFSNLSKLMLDFSPSLSTLSSDFITFFNVASGGFRGLNPSAESTSMSLATLAMQTGIFSTESNGASDSALMLARALYDAGYALADAISVASGASSALSSVGNTASNAAGGVIALTNALATLFSIGGGIASGAADINAMIAEKIKVSKMDATEKAVYNSTRTGDFAAPVKDLNTKLTEAQQAAGAALNAPVGGSYALSLYNKAKAERDAAIKAIEDGTRQALANEKIVAEAARDSGGGGGKSDSEKAAEKDAKAYAKVVESLNAEIEALGKTELQKRILNEQRQASVDASSAEGKAVADLVIQLTEQEKQLARNREITELYAQSFNSMIDDLISGSFDAGNALKSLGASLIKIGLNGLLTNGIPSIFGEGAVLDLTGGGAKATGGPVVQGNSYLVGEHGPERFTPSVSGSISSAATTKIADQRKSSFESAGNVHLNFNPVIDARGADAAAVARLEANLLKMAAQFDSNVVKAMSKAEASRVKWRR